MLGQPFYLLPLWHLRFSLARNSQCRNTDLVSTQNLGLIS
nr:MAG TPA: hypothetical protein [Caudoviricetes sp.]DAN48791.1 MAG TPA: hypothetical protein [Caudoviricetes sp.]DAX98874.1 MAG TPA: hypothetical protein [Caudoviricetes sp.]